MVAGKTICSIDKAIHLQMYVDLYINMWLYVYVCMCVYVFVYVCVHRRVYSGYIHTDMRQTDRETQVLLSGLKRKRGKIAKEENREAGRLEW